MEAVRNQHQDPKKLREEREVYRLRILQNARELADQGKEFHARDIDPEDPNAAGIVLRDSFYTVYRHGEQYRLSRRPLTKRGNYVYFRTAR